MVNQQQAIRQSLGSSLPAVCTFHVMDYHGAIVSKRRRHSEGTLMRRAMSGFVNSLRNSRFKAFSPSRAVRSNEINGINGNWRSLRVPARLPNASPLAINPRAPPQ